MHFIKYPRGFRFVGVVSFGFEDKMRGKLRVSPERLDALEGVTKVNLKAFPSYINFVALEWRGRRRNVLINNVVEFT